MAVRAVAAEQVMALVEAAAPPGAQPPPQAPAGAAPPTVQAASASESTGWAIVMALGAIGAVLLAWWLVTIGIDDPGFKDRVGPVTPVEGLTIFAVFFVGAAGIERLLEPVATIVAANKNEKLVAAAGDLPALWTAWVTAAEAAVADAAKKGDETTARTALEEKMKALAEAQGASTVSAQRLQIGMWGLASVIGIVSAASLKLYLLSAVGIASPNRGLEVLATGLIIGAGTKPLHDLTKLIEAKKEANQAAAPAAT